MDPEHAAFRDFFRLLAASPSRRSIARAVAGLALAGPLCALLGLADAEARRKSRKRKKKKCAKASQAAKKKKRCCRGLLKDAAGRCAPPCTATSCAANSLCVERVCQPCDVCQPAGACAFDTVQAAIDATPHLTTIRICPGIYVGDLTIARSLTLIGAGSGNSDGTDTVLQGIGDESVLRIGIDIGHGTEVTLERLRIRRGGGSIGGGIEAQGRLTLIDCIITENTAGVFGGGIYKLGGVLTLTNSTIIGNRAGSLGGGIHNESGIVTLDAVSQVLENEAALHDPESGGGIFNQGGSVTLSNSANVSGNTPNQCSGDAVPLCLG